MEDPLECPICFDEMKTIVQLDCCKTKLCVTCYARSFETCPFCRTPKQPILPVVIFITEWTRIAKLLCVTIFASACLSIGILNSSSFCD